MLLTVLTVLESSLLLHLQSQLSRVKPLSDMGPRNVQASCSHVAVAFLVFRHTCVKFPARLCSNIAIAILWQLTLLNWIFSVPIQNKLCTLYYLYAQITLPAWNTCPLDKERQREQWWSSYFQSEQREGAVLRRTKQTRQNRENTERRAVELIILTVPLPAIWPLQFRHVAG